MLILTGKNRCYSTTQNLYRVKPGTNSLKLRQPPAVVPAYVSPNTRHSKAKTPMSKYGWDAYLKKLNPKFDAAIDPGLGKFNNRHYNKEAKRRDITELFYEGADKMESLLFAGNLVRAEPYSFGWLKVITLDYYAGPPTGMPTYEQNPIFVQRFTKIGRLSRKLSLRRPILEYPVVSRVPIYIPEDRLEPWSKDMETEMPR